MSYAGPVSRGKRAPAASRSRPKDPRHSGTNKPPTAASAADDSTDPRPAAVFAVGVVLGLALGAAAALLLTPYDAAEYRRALARQRRRLGQRSHDAWDDLRVEFRRALRRRRRANARKREQAQGGEPDDQPTGCL